MQAEFDIADRIHLTSGRPLVTGIAQPGDVALPVLAGGAHIAFRHDQFSLTVVWGLAFPCAVVTYRPEMALR